MRWILATHRGVPLAFVAILFAGSLLAVPQPAAACSFYNPICWIEEGKDYFEDLAEDVADLAWDLLTLDPKEAWEDFKDIANNAVCGPLTPLSLAVSNGVKADFSECASPHHPIAPPILAQLSLYFESSFDSVRIHEDCTLDGDIVPGSRDAITFGEHIYFARGAYHPQDDAGFALLAHELTHVLQYRKKGFGDFTCEYGLYCQLGADTGCTIEQQAYIYQALVFEDVRHPDGGDGTFTCALEPHEWGPDNVNLHTCNGKPLLDNCPDDYNPEQEDYNRNKIGDACDFTDYRALVSCLLPPLEGEDQELHTTSCNLHGGDTSSAVCAS